LIFQGLSDDSFILIYFTDVSNQQLIDT